MDNIIERYIYDVIRRLPENDRSDVERELRAGIADMLSDQPTESETAQVLENLGNPFKLAEQYRVNPRYLISPAIFENYIAALKIIIPVAASIMGLLGLVFYFNEGIPVSFAGAVTGMLSGALSGSISVLFTVTIGFALADYFQFRSASRKWSISDLPELPAETSVRIKRSETVTGMLFSVVFIACAFAVMRNPQLIGWYSTETAPVPLFISEALSRFIPWLILVSIISLVISFIKLIFGRWNYMLAMINSLYGLFSAAVLLLFMSGAEIFHLDFLTKVSQVLSITIQQMESYSRISLIGLVSFIIILIALDIAAGWYKAYKGRR